MNLRETAQALHATGLTTPEICQRLGLGLDAVMALLLPAPMERQKDVPRVRRCVGRPPWTIGKEEGRQLLSRLVNHGCSAPAIWKLPELVSVLREVIPHPPSPDTVRRVLDGLGLTFAAHAERLRATGRELPWRGEGGGVLPRRQLLYLVTHRTTRQLGVLSLPPATVVVGLTPGNRVAFAVRMQNRMTPKFLRDFLDGLSALHPNRRVVGIIE